VKRDKCADQYQSGWSWRQDTQEVDPPPWRCISISVHSSSFVSCVHLSPSNADIISRSFIADLAACGQRLHV